MRIHGSTYFLQDGAPCHASKKIKTFLAEQPFQVIDWPGNSPDLNPIENCWNFMKNRLRGGHFVPAEPDQGDQAALDLHAQQGLPQEPQRQVLKAKGDP
jgi:hypothetical protein